jgi:hypothetical protein
MHNPHSISSTFADWLHDVIRSEAGLLSGCEQISK